MLKMSIVSISFRSIRMFYVYGFMMISHNFFYIDRCIFEKYLLELFEKYTRNVLEHFFEKKKMIKKYTRFLETKNDEKYFLLTKML